MPLKKADMTNVSGSEHDVQPLGVKFCLGRGYLRGIKMSKDFVNSMEGEFLLLQILLPVRVATGLNLNS